MSASKSRESLPAELDAAAQGVHESGEQGSHVQLQKHGIGIRKSSTSEPTIYSRSLPSEPSISRASGHPRPDPSAPDCPAGPPSTLDEATRAQRAAALRRLHGTAAKAIRPSSAANSKPVLVRSHSVDMPSPKAAIADASEGLHGRSIEKSNYELPPVEAFSFQEILQSISSDIRIPIDRIAEICGKSKLSLANEYSSHMPPQAEFTPASFQRANDSLDAVFRHRLLPVEEASSSHERLWEGREPEDTGPSTQMDDGPGRPAQDKRHSRAKSASWALLGTQAPAGSVHEKEREKEKLIRTAAPIAATSPPRPASHSLDLEPLPNAKPPPGSLSRRASDHPGPAASVDFATLSGLVPSWLRHAGAGDGAASPAGREAGAKEALNRLLAK